MKQQRYVLTAILMTSIAVMTLSGSTALTSVSTTTPAAATTTIIPSADAQTTPDTTADTITTLADDTLFVGDTADDTIKIIDITEGDGQVFIAKNNGGGGEGGYRLHGPRGMVVISDTLLVVNQNVNLGKRGEILKFNVETGDFEGFLVKNSNRDAPWAPRGMVVSPDGGVVYVASFEGRQSTKSDLAPGAILAYDSQTGQFLGSFTPDEGVLPEGTEFHPRGLVFSPEDGKLYISGTGDLTSDPATGYILTLNPSTNDFELFVSTQDAADLHRPEGLAFDNQGNLWVTSFIAGATDTDRILAFNSGGELINTIELYQSGEPRAFAQAILFGPNGDLFVPISNTGELRRYDIDTGEPIVVTDAGDPLLAPWYLTFKATDPSTLQYNGSD